MKKILSILLLVACVFSVASCNKNKGGSGFSLANYETYFASSVPTKAVTKVSQTISTTTLESVTTLTTGSLADGTKASVYESNVQTFNDIESLELNYIKEKKTVKWYCEGKGISTNKGRTWDAEGLDFANGPIYINLDSELYDGNISYDNATDTLVLGVSAENSATALASFLEDGQKFEYDSTITIAASGGRISSIKVEYSVDPYDIGDDIANMIEIEEIKVVIEASYSYDYQTINFN